MGAIFYLDMLHSVRETGFCWKYWPAVERFVPMEGDNLNYHT
jgi:hypothetical protein